MKRLVKYRTFQLVFFATLISISIANSTFHSQTVNLIADHLTLEDGIPSRCINCIYQDSRGFLWFGTRNGLVKYDGYKLTTFKPNGLDSTSIGMRFIYSIEEDKEGNIWTSGPILSRYSVTENKFINFTRDKIVPFPRVDVNVVHGGYHFSGYNGTFSKLLIDKDENLWIGTHSYGLYKTSLRGLNENVITPKFELVFRDLGIEGTISINSIVEDKNQNIWIGTNNGLAKISNVSDEIQLYQSIKSVKYLKENHITDIIVDGENILWLATFGYGLCKFNTIDNSFTYKSLKTLTDPKEYTNSVYTIAIDKSGTIWCGMKGNGNVGGIVTFDKNSEKINRYLSDQNKDYTIGPYYWWVNDIFIDNAGLIWAGYRGGPLDKIIPEKNAIKYVSFYDYKEVKLNEPTVYDFQPLNESQVLILTGSGVLKHDLQSGAFTNKFPSLNNTIHSIPGEKTLLLDTKGILWIGTVKGLIQYDTIYSAMDFVRTDSLRKAAMIVEDDDYDYWIATFGNGLIKYNIKTKQRENFRHDPNNAQTIRDDFINHIYKDNSGCVWLGTDGSWFTWFDKSNHRAKNYYLGATYVSRVGPFKKDQIWITTGSRGFLTFNKLTENFREYSSDNAFPHKETLGVVKDYNGFYWVIGNNYVLKFDTETDSIQSFNIKNESNYIFKSYYEYNNAKVVFLRATRGFYYFYPEDMRYNRSSPRMVITDFKVFNKSLVNHKDSILTKHINFAEEIELAHNMNDFTFEFSALHYVDPQKNRYKYILENYDQDWKYISNERSARYTALPAGEYIFKVLGSNSDGIWANQPATFAITILPPWWKTWWAYSMYVITIFFLLMYLYLLQKRRLRIKHEMEMKDFESIKLIEVDQMKSKFFANISHEFRTPLTLIKGPVEKLLEKEKTTDKRKIYTVILRNSERLLNLINELLDLSKLESGKMKLSAQESDIVSFIKAIVMSFESYAQRKQIQINVTSNNEVIYLFFDKEKMQKILTNLISNACKFTSEKGQINVDIEEDITNKKLTIKVSDNGIGISEKDLPRIFDRFYQAANNEHTDHAGTGIGLSLTKELVEMHHGKIDVESEESKGTTFTISLLLGRKHLNTDEIIYDEKEYKEITIEEDEVFDIQSTQDEETTLLIVEDNKDVRDFIKSIIENKYQIIEAEDGSDGFNKAIEFMPDLIVSDIMMPKMMGDKMTEKLKKNKITSHIPIILLTAKASEEEKVNGLETGADDYLIKPFNEKELLVRIYNLISQRRKLREKYLREAEINPIEVAVTSLDKKFIETVITVVEENLSNPNFGIDNLVDKIAVSRAQLYRKFSSILGEKPNEFIRKQRIKRAAELIKKDFGNITEIAFEVGFNDLSYFSKCFKKVFKMNPHEYSNKYFTDKSL